MKNSLSLLFLLPTFGAMAQNSIDRRTSEFSVPVLFDFTHSSTNSSYGFTYELTESELRFENLGQINDQTFNLKLLNENSSKMEVSLPSRFFDEIEVQLINTSGKSLLKRNFDKKELANYKMEKSLGKVSRFTVDDLKDVIQKIIAEKEPVKLCIAQTNEKSFTRLCSRNFGIVDRNGKKEIKFEVKVDSNTRALIENETAPLKGSVTAASGMPVRAFFEFQRGTVFEMINKPKTIDFIEVTQEGNNVKFFGMGTLPYGAVKRERQSVYILRNLIPFDATIGDFREYYTLVTPAANLNPVIVVSGEGGGLFQYNLSLAKVPKESNRIYFKNGTPNSTYEDKFKIYVSSDKPIKFNSSDVKSTEEENEFIWTPTLSKKGEFNKSNLEYEKEGIKNRAYLEVYRGFSQEFSLKLTGISMPKGFVTLGEVSYNSWFEDFGTKPGSYLYQRLGVGLTYFKSLNEIKVDESDTRSDLQSMNFSLKYRFTPGLWNWDESWGAIVSFQELKYQSISAPMAGVGFFWARSMPQVFDSIFNIIPFFRYPKWVDLDYTYFPTSLDSKIKVKDSMVLNFHGKILWTKRVYGEAGFGMKSFNLENGDIGAEVRSLYLTVGLGLNF